MAEELDERELEEVPELPDIPIMDISVLLAASKNRHYRTSVRDSFRSLVGFLHEMDLATASLQALSEEFPPDDFCLYESDLTPDGVRLVDEVVPRWFAAIERGTPTSNVGTLTRGLAKIRGRDA